MLDNLEKTTPSVKQIAVIIPCYKEEPTIAEVVSGFRTELPDADIYVFDNNSPDRTADEAGKAGAIVHHTGRQGKGFVVQSMFSVVDADVYVMVDGDATYPPEAVHDLIAPVLDQRADMVVGSRLHAGSDSAFDVQNRLANKLILFALNSVFRVRLTDVLSGYRAFSRDFVKGVPLFGGGFEIETELTIKAIERNYRILEMPVNLAKRPEGSSSKIRFARDGILILSTLLSLFRDYKPLTFFGAIGVALFLIGLIPGTIVIVEFIRTGLVPRLPSAVLATGFILSGLLSIAVGLILHTIVRRFQEFDFSMRIIRGEIDDLARRSARRAHRP